MDDYALWGTKPGKFNSSADGDIIDCYLATEVHIVVNAAEDQRNLSQL